MPCEWCFARSCEIVQVLTVFKVLGGWVFLWNSKSSLTPPVAARLLIFRATMISRLPICIPTAELWRRGLEEIKLKCYKPCHYFVTGQQFFLYEPSDYCKPLINFQSSGNIDFDSLSSNFIAFIEKQIVEVLSLPCRKSLLVL